MPSIHRARKTHTLHRHVIGFAFTFLAASTGSQGDVYGESVNVATATLKAEARDALRAYLNRDCGVIPKRKPPVPMPYDQLLQLAPEEPEIETTLISLLQSVPAKDDRAAMSRALEDEWSGLKTFLDQKPELGLRPDDLRILQQLMDKRESYVERGLERIQHQYKERAAIALDDLAARGSATAKKALNEIMNTGDESSKAAIKQARERLTPPAGTKNRQ